MDKMLETSVEKLGCKHSISWTWDYKGGVSQLNGSGYNPWGGWTCHIHSPEHAYSINQDFQRKRWTVGEWYVV